MKSKLIAFSIFIVGVLVLLFGCGQTHAYETDTFSYTMEEVTYNNHKWYKVLNTGDYSTSEPTFMMVNFTSPYTNGIQEFSLLTCYDNEIARSTISSQSIYYNSSLNYNTLIFSVNNFDLNNKNNFTIVKNNVLGSCVVVNIDFVPYYLVTTDYYLQTYAGNLESQLSTLQNNYNELESNYNELENNYNELENNYNDLEEAYDLLETNFGIYDANIVFNPSHFSNKLLYLNNVQQDYDSYSQIDWQGYAFNLENRNIEVIPGYNFNSDNVYVEDIMLDTYYQSNYYLIQATYILSEVYNESFSIDLYDNTKRVVTLNYTDSIQQENQTLKFQQNVRFNRFVITFNVNGSNSTENGYIQVSIQGSYQNGYKLGYDTGIQIGFNNGRETGIAIGYVNGREIGYTNGYNDASNLSENLIQNTIFSVAETPFQIFSQIFGFEIFGINFSGLFYALLTMLVVVWLIKKFTK